MNGDQTLLKISFLVVVYVLDWIVLLVPSNPSLLLRLATNKTHEEFTAYT